MASTGVFRRRYDYALRQNRRRKFAFMSALAGTVYDSTLSLSPDISKASNSLATFGSAANHSMAATKAANALAGFQSANSFSADFSKSILSLVSAQGGAGLTLDLAQTNVAAFASALASLGLSANLAQSVVATKVLPSTAAMNLALSQANTTLASFNGAVGLNLGLTNSAAAAAAFASAVGLNANFQVTSSSAHSITAVVNLSLDGGLSGKSWVAAESAINLSHNFDLSTIGAVTGPDIIEATISLATAVGLAQKANLQAQSVGGLNLGIADAAVAQQNALGKAGFNVQGNFSSQAFNLYLSQLGINANFSESAAADFADLNDASIGLSLSVTKATETIQLHSALSSFNILGTVTIDAPGSSYSTDIDLTVNLDVALDEEHELIGGRIICEVDAWSPLPSVGVTWNVGGSVGPPSVIIPSLIVPIYEEQDPADCRIFYSVEISDPGGYPVGVGASASADLFIARARWVVRYVNAEYHAEARSSGNPFGDLDELFYGDIKNPGKPTEVFGDAFVVTRDYPQAQDPGTQNMALGPQYDSELAEFYWDPKGVYAEFVPTLDGPSELVFRVTVGQQEETAPYINFPSFDQYVDGITLKARIWYGLFIYQNNYEVTTFSEGDILQVAVDTVLFHTARVWFGKNGVWYPDSEGNTGDPALGTYPNDTLSLNVSFPVLFYYHIRGTVGSVSPANGQDTVLKVRTYPSEFSYTPPAGFTPLGYFPQAASAIQKY